MVLVKNITALIVMLLLISAAGTPARADPIVRSSDDQADCCSDPNTVGTNIVRTVNVNLVTAGVIPLPSFKPTWGKLLDTVVTLAVSVTATFTTKGSAITGPRVVYTETPTITFDLARYNVPTVVWEFEPYSIVCRFSTCRGVEAPGIWTYADARIDYLVYTEDPNQGYGGDIPFTVSGKLQGLSGEAQATEKWIIRAQVHRAYEPPIVNIYADAFIPEARVPNPAFGLINAPLAPNFVPIVDQPFFRPLEPNPVNPAAIFAFSGNNRDFEQFGSSKLYQAITVDLNPNDPPIVRQAHDTGSTIAYAQRGGVQVAKAPTTGLTESVTRTPSGVSVHLHGEATNPFVPFAPSIVQDYIIDLSTADGDTIDYSIQGNTTFYPAFEIYFGCRLIMGEGTPYKPVVNDPSALLLPTIHTVRAVGSISATDAAGCDPPTP
jgi:hypothetical protein